MMADRRVLLVIDPNPLFRAHWAIFVPRLNDPKFGTKIHVTGSLLAGFEHEFGRNYNCTGTNVTTMTISDSVPAACIIDTIGEDYYTDTTAIDEIERIALTVPAPGKSLRSTASHVPTTNIEVQDCQLWIKNYVRVLVQAGICHAGALAVVDSAPAH